MRTPHPAPRYEVAISSTEYDVALVRLIAEQLSARLSVRGAAPIWIGDGGVSGAQDDTGDTGWLSARVIVMLHERLWGRTPGTEDASTAIAARRARDGTDFLRVVPLDDAVLPSWSGGVESRRLDDGVDGVVEWVVEAVRAAGGVTRAAGAPVPEEADGRARRAHDSGLFLASARALLVCAREFERLTDDIAAQATAIDPERTGAKAEVRRMPGRCIIQLGPVALTISWVRDHVDTVAAGRLLIAEWRGTVARSAARLPEYSGLPAAPRAATLLRERILLADATGEPDWLWRREEAMHAGYTSRDLAALCVASLLLSLQECGA